jgi:hypothetical protein
MEVKGSVLQSVPKFIRTRFGEDALPKWLARLGPQAVEVYSKPIMPSMWYPIIPCLAEPTVVLCDLFYQGDLKGAWESGRFTADEALRGIYRIFAIVGSPQTVLKKGATAMPMLYRPTEIGVVDMEEKRATLRITKFPAPHPALDGRLGGFVEQSLIICGVKNLTVKTGRLMTKGDPCSEYHVAWG